MYLYNITNTSSGFRVQQCRVAEMSRTQYCVKKDEELVLVNAGETISDISKNLSLEELITLVNAAGINGLWVISIDDYHSPSELEYIYNKKLEEKGQKQQLINFKSLMANHFQGFIYYYNRIKAIAPEEIPSLPEDYISEFQFWSKNYRTKFNYGTT